MKKFAEELYIFAFGGGAYYILELLYRGRSHYSMFLLGGLCVFLLYKINIWFPKLHVVLRAVIGAATISMLEFISGCILNIWMGMNIWDYASLPLNIFGQVSLLFSFYWFLLCIPVLSIMGRLRLKGTA